MGGSRSGGCAGMITMGLAFVAAGCATRTTPTAGPGSAGGSAAVASEFPSRSALAQLEAIAVPSPRASARVVDASRWSLQGPFPAMTGDTPADTTDAALTLLHTALGATGARLHASAQSQCATREIGRFELERSAAPASDLLAFLLARCGMAGNFAGGQTLTLEHVEDATEAEMFQELGRALAEQPQVAQLGAEGRTVGAWFGRKQGRGLFVLAAYTTPVDLQSLPFVPSGDGTVTIQGRLKSSAGGLSAWVTRGPYDTAECVHDPAVALPAFTFRCPVRTEDPTAWVSVMAQVPGRHLMRRVFETLVFPARVPQNEYTRTAALGEALRSSTAASGDPSGQVLSLLNGVRQTAHRAPLRVSPEQSRVACSLLPFLAAGDERDVRAEMALLGMMAGWDVGTPIRDGMSQYQQGMGSARPEDLVADAIRSPYTRQTLLDREATLGAACVRTDAEAGTTVLWGTYVAADPSRRDADARVVLDALDRARRTAGKPASAPLPAASALLARALGEYEAGRTTAQQALDTVGDPVAAAFGTRTHFLQIETSDVTSIEFPAEIVQTTSLTVGLAVGYVQRPGEPWTSTVVWLAYRTTTDTI